MFALSPDQIIGYCTILTLWLTIAAIIADDLPITHDDAVDLYVTAAVAINLV